MGPPPLNIYQLVKITTDKSSLSSVEWVSSIMRKENGMSIMYINFTPCNYKHGMRRVFYDLRSLNRYRNKRFFSFLVYLLFYADDKFWRA